MEFEEKKDSEINKDSGLTDDEAMMLSGQSDEPENKEKNITSDSVKLSRPLKGLINEPKDAEPPVVNKTEEVKSDPVRSSKPSLGDIPGQIKPSAPLKGPINEPKDAEPPIVNKTEEVKSDPVRSSKPSLGDAPGQIKPSVPLKGISFEPPKRSSQADVKEPVQKTEAKIGNFAPAAKSRKSESNISEDSSRITQALGGVEKSYEPSSKESLDRVYYVFISVTILFYVLSGWVLLAYFSIIPLPGPFEDMIVSLGKILA